ncbi:MAG: ethanolamine ammonia-lyase subunit EutB, partial [Bacteroidota bacterium]
LSNDELIDISRKVFHPLAGSKIGSKGYMGARVQPNSPTDDPEDIFWQVMDAWSYAVGDVVLGTNPVSSDVGQVARIESALQDIITTFKLEDTIPHCVLAHIDIQSKVEELRPGSTGIWFQSIAGTDDANKTFDVTIGKLKNHLRARSGRYGFYAETGQGADETNGHGAGFDMLLHESRKYGLLRAVKKEFLPDKDSWLYANDVAGFIGPEVFRTKEQLVRCCLEDLVMGKLHGLTLGLDICTTLHMDVTLDDLDWCIERIMPANPAYLMALPTKNDPMLSYLTTSFSDHLRIRHEFGYKVNDAMWEFFQSLDVISAEGRPSKNFGDPAAVYIAYRRAKGDMRTEEAIRREGDAAIARVRQRGVPIAIGTGVEHWMPPPALDAEIRRLYADAKFCLWQEMDEKSVSTIPNAVLLSSVSTDRVDYVYHPATGEVPDASSVEILEQHRASWGNDVPRVQIVISDGLNVRSLFDENHLAPFLTSLHKNLRAEGITCGDKHFVIHHGRVRAGYRAGEILFGSMQDADRRHVLLHVIGERPGSEHRNFSVYMTGASRDRWNVRGSIDHDQTRVVSGISDTALTPEKAAAAVTEICKELLQQVG